MTVPVAEVIEIARTRFEGLLQFAHLPSVIGPEAAAFMLGERPRSDDPHDDEIAIVAPAKQDPSGF